MRLLDLVEQDHAVRAPAHGFGEVAALLVADVARGRADLAADRVHLHELAHVDAHHRVRAVEQELGQRLAQLGLAHARSEEHTYELQSLMRISYAVSGLKKKNLNTTLYKNH